jgi:iron complex outermembrane receptor protein
MIAPLAEHRLIMNLFRLHLLLFVIGPGLQLCAQSADSTKDLVAVEVMAQRFDDRSTGNKSQVFDSVMLSRYSNADLASLISSQSLIFVKSYSPGTLATTSFRGAGASHTAVLWNGFNLQSPMNGMLDLALVPSFFMNSIRIHYGSSAAAWGGGAVGGSILLGNEPDFEQGLSIFSSHNFGSFSDQQQQGGFEYSGKNFISSVRFFDHSALNDFSFHNTAQYGAPLQKQQNAEIRQHGIMQENYFRLGRHQKINTRVWYQYNNRNIPPSMTVNISRSKQIDEALRISSEWQHTGEKVIYMARAAYFDEDLFFVDPLIALNSKNNSRVFISELESHLKIKHEHTLNILLNNTNSSAITKDYRHRMTENRFAVFLGYTFLSPNRSSKASLNIRQEFNEGQVIPFTPSLGLEQRIFKYFFLKMNAARHYRLPTFNDKYFRGAGGIGNPELAAEDGWNAEGGIAGRYTGGILSGELSATAFNRKINNWILWRPITATIWTPENILKVWSRGLEYDLKINVTVRNWQVSLGAKYNYIRSTNEQELFAGDPSLHKQLIYVPVQNAQGDIAVRYKSAAISCTQTYTGYRYYSSDNLEYLKPYSVINVQASNVFRIRKSSLKLFVQLNNILNEEYQVYAYRAMPLFNWQAGLTIFFQNNFNDK